MTRAWIGALGVALAAALAAPVGASLVAVALFAGPHNAVVLRYALARVPGRPGPLASYVALGAGGTVLLAGASIALALGAWLAPDETELLTLGQSVWLSLVVLWIAALASLRAGQAPRRAWADAVPLAVLALGACWTAPAYVSLALVYLHPLVALAVLDRELARRRLWISAYRRSLVWIALAAALVTGAHAGGALALVALHSFLELVHYAVWLVVIPRLALGPIPLERRARHAVRALLAAAGAAVVALWVGFAWDAVLTRDVYFVLATGHVLAEVPLLLRLL